MERGEESQKKGKKLRGQESWGGGLHGQAVNEGKKKRATKIRGGGGELEGGTCAKRRGAS